MSSSSFDELASTPRWWLLELGRDPIGPLNGEILLEWVRAGLVQNDALICVVGEQEWQTIGDPVRLVAHVEKRRSRFDPSKERCLLDIEPVPDESAPPESGERPFADAAPARESGPPSGIPEADRSGETTRIGVLKPLPMVSVGGESKAR